MRTYPACIGSPLANENWRNRRASLTVHELRTLDRGNGTLTRAATFRGISSSLTAWLRAQNAPGLMNRPILRDLVAAATDCTASWLIAPGVLPLGAALAVLPQSVEPDLYVAHRKLVKALGTNAGNDVQAAEDLS
jgi:hypothetical protein